MKKKITLPYSEIKYTHLQYIHSPLLFFSYAIFQLNMKNYAARYLVYICRSVLPKQFVPTDCHICPEFASSQICTPTFWHENFHSVCVQEEEVHMDSKCKGTNSVWYYFKYFDIGFYLG